METEVAPIPLCASSESGRAITLRILSLSLHMHADGNLSAQQSAEIIADHFSSISQDYEPIEVDNFPPRIREVLKYPDLSMTPVLEEYQVYKRISKAKKPNSTVSGDLPKKIVQEYSRDCGWPRRP